MRVMAGDAFALRARMLHLRRLDLLSLLFMAGEAERTAISVGQNNFSVLCRLMAAVAHLAFERRVQERLHQLGLGRLVRVMALQAVGRAEWLIQMRLLQCGVLHVVTVDAERRHIFLQVRCELDLPFVAVLMREVAGVASHIERRVPAALFGDVHANLVAGQAEILIAGRAR